MIRTRFHTAAIAILAAPLALLASGAEAATEMTFSSTAPDEKPPAAPMSKASAPVNAPDMQAVVDAQRSLGPKPIETLSPAEARKQPSPADGVKLVMKQKGLPTGAEPGISSKDVSYGSDALEMARIYSPDAAPGAKPRPIIVYYHGGGWVIADIQTYAATPSFLAKQLNAIVISVEYRRAPEAKFPAQHEDAVAAYEWTLKNAKAWGGDPANVALAGESAGGNLAVATAIYARDHKLQAPVHILAVYPIANSDMMLPSKTENGNTKPLNTAMLGWFTHYYAGSAADVRDTRINLVSADLHGLPPTTIINAQNDPLRSDGETLAAAMQKAGDTVEQKTFPGVTHEFFGMGKVVAGAMEAETYAVSRLQPALMGKEAMIGAAVR